MGDDLPLEMRTVKVRRSPRKNFQLRFNKHGQETSVEWPVEVVWETEKTKEDWVGGIKVRREGRREVVRSLTWGNMDASTRWDIGRNFGDSSLLEDVMERLRAELEALKESMLPELEQKREEAARRAVARLTGKGAEDRRAKVIGLLAEAFIGIPEEIEPRVLHGIFKTHAEGLFISQVFDSGPVTIEARKGIFNRLQENGVSAEEAMVAIEAMHGLDMKKAISHAFGNPTHWALVTVDDFSRAIGLARVKEVLQS